MLTPRRNLLSAALASAITFAAAGVHAQATDTTAEQEPATETTDLDQVVVTGIRRGIEDAISIKRESTSIVEAISAEDIGKLPDVSIGESISRLPGVSAQRVAGRAQVISVRGLSPDFSTTLLNGREMVSTGDNRSVEFDQYPSELVSGVTIYKTPDAGLIGQGLSGTLDMQTARPLNFAETVIAVSGRYQENSLGDAANIGDDGGRFNASYIDQFADGRFGIAIGWSHSDTPIQENQVGLYEPWQAIGDNWRPGVAEGTYYSDGIKALRRTGRLERDGVMATLQFRPSNAWTSTLDLFYSKAEQVDTANQFEVHIGDYNGGFDRLDITGTQVNGNNTFTGGVANNVYPLVRGMYNKREDKIEAAGWNNEFSVGGARVVADVSWSRTTRDELSLENNTQLTPMPQLDSVQLDLRTDGFSQLVPGRDYSNPESLFLTGTIYGSGYGKTPRVEDELAAFKIAATLPVDRWIADIDVGLNYADRSKNKRQPEGNINLGAQGDTTIASDLQYGLVDLGFAGVGYIPSWNVPEAVARYMTFNPVEDLDYLIPKAWTVDEQLSTGYVRANINTDWGSVGVRGNFGVQVQHTDQSSSANYWDGSQPVGSQVIPITKGNTYTDILPSLNLAFLFNNDSTLRVALARQVARPRVDQMRASMEFGVDTTTGIPGAGGGNPELDPWRANAFDISYEKYFGTRAYVAAAYFYKDLRSYIYTQTRDGYDFTDQVASWLQANGANYPGLVVQNEGRYSAPFNGSGGTLQGLELSASLPLDLVFGDALRGFGVVASASFNDSDISILAPENSSSVGNDPITLPGLSDRVYNLTAYFERNGFEARVSQRRRSDFIGEIGNFSGERTLRYVVGENITDAQLSYTFSGESALAGMTLLLQASNLTDESYRTYSGSKDRPLERIEWGRTYLVGLNYKF
ncbi:TonB-dependent receptor [Luteimonas marina]|uniref:TonB-dependent receptor n=1 Tax=Luteimonas marina TaxID=488485 RepID=A0A5C5U490_9GAMM|nr:TonB-dependent receptor [Luteimonas marina]TWT20342.1 TonB-dependent receptor [Luteimonas marina]